MGLGKRDASNTIYLTIAGGSIWNRKADESDPNYETQEWVDNKGETRLRKGARYDDLLGRITNFYTKVHEQYGEAAYIVIQDGEDSFTLNIKTNTANSQCMLKALLLMDLEKDVLISPYDFVPNGETRRRQGISFKQNGEKINLTDFVLPEEWKTDKDFWKPSNKKKYTRFLEDFSDWLISEVEEKVVPNLTAAEPVATKEAVKEEVVSEEPVHEVDVEDTPEPKEEKPAKVSPLKMKKFLKAYIAENYEGKELPKLSKEEVIKWYELVQNLDELPFEKEGDLSEAEEDYDAIQAQLMALGQG